MEPMTLSPSSPPVNYLPGYLLGGGGGPDSGGRAGGGGGSAMEATLSYGADLSTGSTSMRNVASSPLMSKSSIPPHNRPDYNRGSKTKLDGPPIAGLFDDLPYKNTSLTFHSFTLPNSVESETSVQNNDEPEHSGFWIIVFGFPPSHQPHILSMFSQLGRVLEHSYPSNGNWMFIRYQSRMDVRKALSQNERVIGGNFMIGVSERRGRPTMKEASNDSSIGGAANVSIRSPETSTMGRMGVTSPAIMSPNALSPHVTSPFNTSSLTSPKIRSLTAARRETTIVNPHLTPTRDTSVVSKAIDFLFSW